MTLEEIEQETLECTAKELIGVVIALTVAVQEAQEEYASLDDAPPALKKFYSRFLEIVEARGI